MFYTMLIMGNLKQKIHEVIKLYKSANFSECEKETKKLIKLNPKIVFLYNLLGLCLNALDKTDEAIECYKKGIKIKPN